MIFYYTLHHTCIMLYFLEKECITLVVNKSKLHKFYRCEEKSYLGPTFDVLTKLLSTFSKKFLNIVEESPN